MACAILALAVVVGGASMAIIAAVTGDTAAEKRLHKGRLSPLLASLPPLLTMEKLLFRLIDDRDRAPSSSRVLVLPGMAEGLLPAEG